MTLEATVRTPAVRRNLAGQEMLTPLAAGD